MPCNASAANGIIPYRPGRGDRSAQRWRSVIYCLVVVVIVVVVVVRPHRMYYLYVDAAYCYRPSSVVCQSECRSVTIASPAKTAEPIEMPFALWTGVGPRKSVHIRRGAHWRDLANTIKPSMCGGDA